MNEPNIYLDNNSTTQIDREVAEAISVTLNEGFANPASQHASGRRAHSVLESSRLSLADQLGCRTGGMSADHILFTSGGTESNNLALLGMLESRDGDLVVSSIEHPSVLGMAEEIAKRGIRRVRFLPVDGNGQVCVETWKCWLLEHSESVSRNTLDGRIAMVSLMLANNETGAIQPIETVAESASSNGILVHTDAVQAVGKIPVSFASLKVDAMSITAHKLHGPVGIGALVFRDGVRMSPIFHGGFQQIGIRPGTESVVLAVGLARAVELAITHLQERNRAMTTLRETLEAKLLSSPRPPMILGALGPRLPHTISLSYSGIERQALQMALDQRGIACSTGSACASGSGQPSHVLQAMKLPESVVQGAIRLSLSAQSTHNDILDAARRIIEVVSRFPSSNQ